MSSSDDFEFTQLLAEVARLMDQRRDKEIVDACDRAEAQFSQYFELFYHRAQAKMSLGEKAGAFQDISRAMVLQPGEPALAFFRGLWSVDEGRLAEGIEDLTRALKLEELLDGKYYSESARFVRAVAHLKLGDFRHALDDCESVRPGTTSFVCGRVWTVAEVRSVARGAAG